MFDLVILKKFQVRVLSTSLINKPDLVEILTGIGCISNVLGLNQLCSTVFRMLIECILELY